MWFTQVAGIEQPGRDELVQFVGNVESFLGFVVENRREFAFLWEDEPALQELAMASYLQDVQLACGELRRVIPAIPDERLRRHGLRGRALQLKLRILDSIGRRWEQVRGQLSMREWLKRMFDAIDAIPDSLIDAAGGIGAVIKEFKDALSSLVKTR